LSRLGKVEFLYPGIVFFAALLLYSWTLAPTVTLVDSGELIVAARYLGVAHPPGFPLYIMLAHLASRIPIGNVAQRIHFASAVFAALASAVVTLLVAELIAISSSLKARRRSKKKPANQRKTVTGALAPSLLTLAPALAAGLLVAFSRTLWAYATIAEVYTLNALLIVTIFWLMCKWRRSILEDERSESAKRALTIPDYDWLLYTASAIFGLALGVHHVTVALILPALALFVWKTQGFKFFSSTRFLYAAIVSVVSLIVVYSYLPLAASHDPIVNWGNPRSLTTIWWHITGRQYQVFLSFDPNIIGQELVSLGRFLLREFGPSWLPITLGLALLGFARLLKNDRTIFWFLALVVLTDAAYGTSYFIAEDKDAYYLPAFIAIAIGAGFGLRWLFEWLQTRAVPAATVIALAAVLLLATTTMAANWAFDNRRHYFVAHDYVENILGSIEPNALLLTLDWQVEAPLLYTREIKHRRRDVKVIDVNLLRRPWYFDYLRRAYPDLMARSGDIVEAFFAELKEWESKPEVYARDPALTERIARLFQMLFQSFVTKEKQVSGVYVTSDLLFQTEQQDKELTQWLTKHYQLIPHGLVFKLEEDRNFHDPGPLQLQTRGLADGTLKFEPDDVVILKVLSAYKTMLVNRGRYFSFFNQHEHAIDSFKRALELDSTLELARQGLRDSTEKLRRSDTPSP
jgi:hypothetical protein